MPVRTGEEAILVLQGGGALGAYQGGVYEVLRSRGVIIDWVAGISIGAINAAIIAGNAPEYRLQKLRGFWQRISDGAADLPFMDLFAPREWANEASAGLVAGLGVPGFFMPRGTPPALQPAGSAGAVSLYDTAPLRKTLLEFVDFDRLNDGPMRISVGSVEIESGNFVYFDSAKQRLGPEHIMASGALPPGFPPVEIDGRFYWDGGLVSNTPLNYVMENDGCVTDTAIFQVDLFSAKGPVPRDLTGVFAREKDIRFSSRTRLNSDVAALQCKRRNALARLLSKLPPELAEDADVKLLDGLPAWTGAVALVHLIYRNQDYTTQAKDYLFSRRAIEEHWQAGKADVARTLDHAAWRDRPQGVPGFHAYDLGEGSPDRVRGA